MIEISFREKIVALQQDWLNDPYNLDRSYNFWYVMDSISDELAIKYAEMAIKCKTPINKLCPSDPQEWLAVCNIISYYNNSEDKKLSAGQKRKCLFQVIRYWDNIEMMLHC
jgi:hypothetical protein